MLTIQYMTMRLSAEPSSPNSVTYKVGQSWYDEPTEFMTVPSRKSAINALIDACRGELDATYSDDEGNPFFAQDWQAFKSVKTLQDLGKIPGVVMVGDL